MPFGAWFPQHSNIHSLTLSAPKKQSNFLFKIYTFSRAEKHPSEQQKCENRERGKVGIQEQGRRWYCDSHGDGKPRGS